MNLAELILLAFVVVAGAFVVMETFRLMDSYANYKKMKRKSSLNLLINKIKHNAERGYNPKLSNNLNYELNGAFEEINPKNHRN